MSILLRVAIVLLIFSCESSKQKKDSLSSDCFNETISTPYFSDSLERFFGSRGVIEVYSEGFRMNSEIKLLNTDNSVFCVISLYSSKIEIEKNFFSLDQFDNDSIRKVYNFFPKEFFPDQSVVQFEYLSIDNGIAEVYIDKQKKIKKLLLLKDSLYKIESWKKHFIGRMIDFDPNSNPIRKNSREESNSLGFENSDEDYIFIISKIEGDWIKVECADVCDYPCDMNEKYNGWIRWKKASKLLVKFAYSC